jgi:arginyl-tRNA synthetase
MIKDKLEKMLGFEVEPTENPEFGDYSANIALVRSKEEGKNPRELAEEIVKELRGKNNLKSIIEKIEVAGPGFINFWLKKDVLVDNLIQIRSEKEKYGRNESKKGKKVVVEYTDPNPFKEFHIGHLISNVTGEALTRLQEACGETAWRADYFGDVGTHVAKSIWGLQKKMKEDNLSLEELSKKELRERVNYMGQGYALGTKAYEEDETAKEEIGKLNTIIYMAAQKMWQKEGKEPQINYNPEGAITNSEVDSIYDLYVTGRSWSLEYFETIYKRLGTKFDGYYPESKVGEIGYKYVMDNLGKAFIKSEGAVIFEGEKFGLHTRVFINKHNLPTYEAKELGLAPTKYEDFKYDESIIVVGKEIREYFAVLVTALTQINPKLGEVTKPVFTGMVNLPEGKMSSRKGNVVTVTGIIDQLKDLAGAYVDKSDYSQGEKDVILEKVAVGALKYAFLKNHLGADFVFNMGESLSLEGNSGPYLQYTVARTNSVIAKVKSKSEKVKVVEKLSKEELAVLRALVKFPEVVQNAAKAYSPNLLCNYLYELSSKFNSFYNADKIIGSENEEFRLSLTSAVGQVLKNGLKMLGIETPERM